MNRYDSNKEKYAFGPVEKRFSKIFRVWKQKQKSENENEQQQQAASGKMSTGGIQEKRNKKINKQIIPCSQKFTPLYLSPSHSLF